MQRAIAQVPLATAKTASASNLLSVAKPGLRGAPYRTATPSSRFRKQQAAAPLRNRICFKVRALFGLFEGPKMPEDVPFKKTEAEWKEQLTSEEYYVLRQKGTERPFVGEYDGVYPSEGYFACRACNQPLYSAESKFKSGCGWPAFDKCYEGSIMTETDVSMGMKRVEIMCANCGGHLGHVFEGEGFTETNERHCVNSLSVRYVKVS